MCAVVVCEGSCSMVNTSKVRTSEVTSCVNTVSGDDTEVGRWMHLRYETVQSGGTIRALAAPSITCMQDTTNLILAADGVRASVSGARPG